MWGDARIDAPFVKDGAQLRNILTGEVHTVEGGGIAVAALLASWPTAVLVG